MRRAKKTATRNARRRHHWVLSTPLQPTALEELDRTGAYFGLETRFPFWDRDLVQYSLSLPAKLKRRRGVGRLVLRRAMAGLLPEKVRCRKGKTEFRGSLANAMQEARSDARAKWDAVKPALTEWVDPEAFDALLRRATQRGGEHRCSGAALKIVGRVLQLGEWRRTL